VLASPLGGSPEALADFRRALYSFLEPELTEFSLGLQFSQPGEDRFGEAQEDQAEDGCGVFLGLEAGIGAELV
jgi:hypothetical protein